MNEQALAELCGTALPLTILLIENDADRQWMMELYEQYHELMFITAGRFFGGEPQELEEALDTAVERMCRYFDKLKAIAQTSRPAYIVRLVSNVCRDRLRTRRRERAVWDYHADMETLDNVPDEADIHTIVFDRANAVDLLDSFTELSGRDKDVIAMRHIDGMTMDEIAAALGISKNAAQSAFSRAKHRLEAAAGSRRRNIDEEA